MLKIPIGLNKKTVGQRSVGTCKWAVKVRLIIAMKSITWSLAGLRAFFIAGRDSIGSHHGMLCPWGLLPGKKNLIN